MHYAIDEIIYDYTYSISCDFDNNMFKMTDSSGNIVEFVKKGTQVFEKLSGSKISALKGVWYSENGTAFVLDNESNSGTGLYSTEDKIFYILTPYDWVGTNNELTLQNKNTGKESIYTYVIDNDILSMYSNGNLIGTYNHVNNGYSVEKER